MDGFMMKMSMPPHSYNIAFHSHKLLISSFSLQVVYDRGEMYSFSKYGRFCQEIKLNYSPYKNYFTRVFWNRSYHVYKVNSVISFQYWHTVASVFPDDVCSFYTWHYAYMWWTHKRLLTELDFVFFQCFFKVSAAKYQRLLYAFAVCAQRNIQSRLTGQ